MFGRYRKLQQQIDRHDERLDQHYSRQRDCYWEVMGRIDRLLDHLGCEEVKLPERAIIRKKGDDRD